MIPQRTTLLCKLSAPRRLRLLRTVQQQASIRYFKSCCAPWMQNPCGSITNWWIRNGLSILARLRIRHRALTIPRTQAIHITSSAMAPALTWVLNPCLQRSPTPHWKRIFSRRREISRHSWEVAWAATAMHKWPRQIPRCSAILVFCWAMRSRLQLQPIRPGNCDGRERKLPNHNSWTPGRFAGDYDDPAFTA